MLRTIYNVCVFTMFVLVVKLGPHNSPFFLKRRGYNFSFKKNPILVFIMLEKVTFNRQPFECHSFSYMRVTELMKIRGVLFCFFYLN